MVNINNMDYNQEACFNFIADCISRCFSPVQYGTETKEDRIRFANSKLIEVFCDCSHNFEASRLSKKIKDSVNNL